MLYGGAYVKFKDRLRSIEASLDDLQAGVEATSRAATGIQNDTAKRNGHGDECGDRSILLHVKNLLAYNREQRSLIRELRRSIVDLNHEHTLRRGLGSPGLGGVARRSR